MRPLKRVLCGMVPTIVILLIVSYLTVNNCTDEQLKWMPVVIVITIVLMLIVAFIGAIIQDIEDEADSILNEALDVGSLWIPFM